MDLHANAALSLNERRLLARRVVEERWTLTKAAAAAEVSVRCARKWVRRYRAEGELGLLDRSSAPARVANRTPEDRVQAIACLRRLRFTGPEIAETLGMALSTVSGILTRIGLGRLGRLGLEPARRYERARPGELVHVDVKKLGRIQGGAGKRVRDGLRQHYTPRFTDRHGKRRKAVGWEFVHIAIDDCSRLAYAEVLPDEKATTAIAFLRRAAAFFKAPRHQSRAGAHRQRVPLPLDRARDRLPRARRPPPAHPPLPTPDQRQSRAVHPHPALGLGLRRHLPHELRTHGRT
jgi:transposase